MLIIPYVCAEFRDKAGNTLFRIRPEMLRSMQEVPDAIEQDHLFDLLVADGSIKTPESVAQKKLLEQDPMIGMAATGKTVDVEATKPAKAGKASKAGITAEEKPTEIKSAEAEKK